MTQNLKIFKRTFKILLIGFLLWFFGVFFQLPLIPFIETDFVLNGTSQIFEKGVELQQTNKVTIKLEIPNYFPEKEQCFDTWFSSKDGQHTLTVSDFTISVFNKNGTETKKNNSSLFWDDGSSDETFKIDNYMIAKTNTTNNDKYVFFRSVFNVADKKEFIVHVKANFSVDGIQNNLEKKIAITKKHRLTWNKFRAH
jgi:hypothetical protein